MGNSMIMTDLMVNRKRRERSLVRKLAAKMIRLTAIIIYILFSSNGIGHVFCACRYIRIVNAMCDIKVAIAAPIYPNLLINKILNPMFNRAISTVHMAMVFVFIEIFNPVVAKYLRLLKNNP